jgi:hypothetical protein
MIASLFLMTALLLPVGQTTRPPECQLDRMTATSIDERALEAFRTAAEEYAALHRHMDRALMLDHHAWPDEEGDMDTDLLIDAIRAARPCEQHGNVFNADVADLIRFRLAKALWLQRYSTAETLRAPERGAGPAAAPQVNSIWFGDADAVPWPSLVWELPGLPAELEYKFLGRHLVLVDAHARLVVDVLENALPEN